MMKEPESIPGNSRGEKDLGLMVAVNGPFLPNNMRAIREEGSHIAFGEIAFISLPASAFRKLQFQFESETSSDEGIRSVEVAL